MSGSRITKQQRQAIKSTRRIVKTVGTREDERTLKAVKNHRELVNYGK